MHEEQQDIFGNDTHGNDLTAASSAQLEDHHWPRTMSELVDVFTARAMQDDIVSDEEASSLARWVVLILGNHLGGRQAYLPKGDKLRAALRDQQIWHDFNGRNQVELASKHQLTVIRIYQILSEQRALHRDKIQPKLL